MASVDAGFDTVKIAAGQVDLTPDRREIVIDYIDRAGAVIGKYRKVHGAVGEAPHFWPPKSEGDLEWIMQEGSEFPVFNLDFGTVGIMICYDGYFPETANILSLNGAEIVAWINGRQGSVEDFMVRTSTYRNYIAMVATNLGPGQGTMIGTWPESILARINQTGSHYIIAEIDLKDLRHQRANSRVHHQRKPEVYTPLTETHKIWEAYEK